MYLGMAGLLAGTAVATASLAFALAALIFCLVVTFGVIVPEERYLERLHGPAYLGYKRRVCRWI